jgi:hypothetical protein
MNRITRDRARLMAQTVEAMLADLATKKLIDQFFSDEGPFAGKTFTDLQPNDPYRISPADLLAVTLMDVTFPPRAVRWFLDPSHEAIQEGLLRGLPDPGHHLHELQIGDLAGGNDFWMMLVHRQPPPGSGLERAELDKAFHKIGGVRADKLLARKRPQVFPIYDRWFEELFGARDTEFNYWQATMQVLGDVAVRNRLESLCLEAISPVRILDAMVWTWQSGSQNAEEARKGAGRPGGEQWKPLRS